MSRQVPLTVTNIAIDKIKELMQQCTEFKPYGIRVGVKQGGCSGLKYFLEYAEQAEKFEEVIETQGIRILIEPKAVIYLLGSTMDYIDEKVKTGFIFTNPNSKGECGCGDSFHV